MRVTYDFIMVLICFLTLNVDGKFAEIMIFCYEKVLFLHYAADYEKYHKPCRESKAWKMHERCSQIDLV